MPLEAQPGLLRQAAPWLRPGGWLLAGTRHSASTSVEDGWLGGSAPMAWGEADAGTHRSSVGQARVAINSPGLRPQGDGGHALFWARVPGQRDGPGIGPR